MKVVRQCGKERGHRELNVRVLLFWAASRALSKRPPPGLPVLRLARQRAPGGGADVTGWRCLRLSDREVR